MNVSENGTNVSAKVVELSRDFMLVDYCGRIYRIDFDRYPYFRCCFLSELYNVQASAAGLHWPDADIDLEVEWKYLDDGIFYDVSAKGEFPWVFDTTNGKLRNNNTDDSWKFPIEETTKSENGKIWVTAGKGLTTFDMHEWEPIKQIDSSKEKSYEIAMVCSIVGKTGVVDGVYYDLNGEKIAEVDLYQDQVNERGEFSEAGYAPLVMNDRGHEYITYVNKKGEQQFEPKAINAGSKATEIINGDYFAVAYSDQHVVVIYDYTGQEKHRVENLDVVKILGDDYIISGGKYYFFQ